MNFSSLGEFFYKLYNKCLAVMFIPIAVFLAIYYFLLTGKWMAIIQDEQIVTIILIVFPILAIVNLTIVHLVVTSKFKPLLAELSLGIRLEKYFSVGFIRLAALASDSVLMAAGLALTGHSYFTLYFTGLLVWLFFIWPTPSRVSKDLKLRGDEKKMVMSKGEAFR